jgi:hypothetical protein
MTPIGWAVRALMALLTCVEPMKAGKEARPGTEQSLSIAKDSKVTSSRSHGEGKNWDMKLHSPGTVYHVKRTPSGFRMHSCVLLPLIDNSGVMTARFEG